MAQARAYVEDDRSELDYHDSDSDSDYTLPGDDVSDDGSSISAFRSSHVRPFGEYDPVKPIPVFRLPVDVDPAKPMYEGWVVHLPPVEENVIDGTRVLGVNAVKNYRRFRARPTVFPTDHSQDELAAMHLNALDTYHGSHRSGSGGGGCLPLRRLLRRHTSRKSYDDDIDARIRKLPELLQFEINDLLIDRESHSSTTTRQREWTVAVVREQLYQRFAKMEPTPAHRHRLRWWKDNTKGCETQFFIILVGRETKHKPAGLTTYARHSNPWRNMDAHLSLQERIQAQKADFSRPQHLRMQEHLMAESRRPVGWGGPGCYSPSSNRLDDYSAFPRPALRRHAPPPRVPSPPLFPQFDSEPRRRYYPAPPPPRVPGPPLPPMTVPSAAPAPYMPVHFPPPPPPPRPIIPVPTTGYQPPLHHFAARPPAPIDRPPLYQPAMVPPPSWGYYRSAPPPPPPHPSSFFPTGSMPPSASWPPSPISYRHSPPSSSYGPPPPPPMNAFSALTTPSSLGSVPVPMFGPVLHPPPPPAPPSGCPPPPPPVPAPASYLDSRSASPLRAGPTAPSRTVLGKSAHYPPPPPSPGLDEEENTLVCVSPVPETSNPDQGDKASASAVVVKDEDKSLAKEKPDLHGEDR